MAETFDGSLRAQLVDGAERLTASVVRKGDMPAAQDGTSFETMFSEMAISMGEEALGAAIAALNASAPVGWDASVRHDLRFQEATNGVVVHLTTKPIAGGPSAGSVTCTLPTDGGGAAQQRTSGIRAGFKAAAGLIGNDTLETAIAGIDVPNL